MASAIQYVPMPGGHIAAVVVPTNQNHLDKKIICSLRKRCCCILFGIYGGMFFLSGFIMTVIGLSIDNSSIPEVLLSIGPINLGVGGILLLPSILICCCAYHSHQNRIERHMHRGNPVLSQAGMRYENVPEVVVHDASTRRERTFQPSASSDHSPVTHSGIPISLVQTDVLPNQHPRRQGTLLPPEEYSSTMQGRYSPSRDLLLNSGRASPGRMSPGRSSPARLSLEEGTYGRTSPFRTSPVRMSTEGGYSARSSPGRSSGRSSPRSGSPGKRSGRTSPYTSSIPGPHTSTPYRQTNRPYSYSHDPQLSPVRLQYYDVI